MSFSWHSAGKQSWLNSKLQTKINGVLNVYRQCDIWATYICQLSAVWSSLNMLVIKTGRPCWWYQTAMIYSLPQQTFINERYPHRPSSIIKQTSIKGHFQPCTIPLWTAANPFIRLWCVPAASLYEKLLPHWYYTDNVIVWYVPTWILFLPLGAYYCVQLIYVIMAPHCLICISL